MGLRGAQHRGRSGVSGPEALHRVILDLLALAHQPVASAAGSVFLAVLFVVTGVTKLRDPMRAAWALVDLAALERPAKLAGATLGLVEATLGMALLVPSFRAGALVVASITLWAFAYVLSRQLLLGNHPACFCLGDEEPLRWTSAARTALLAGLASFLSVAAPTDHLLTPPVAVAGVAFFASWTLWREIRRMSALQPQRTAVVARS